MTKMIRTYSELIRIPEFEDRLEYLRLDGVVSEFTFGGSRYLNQDFYKSREWRNFRNFIIVRDSGCDLAHPDFLVPDGVPIYIHHINPIGVEDLLNGAECLMDPENSVMTILDTHNTIHYGRRGLVIPTHVERQPWDTCPWKQ